MNGLQAFLLASAGWFALEAFGLLFLPNLVITILESRSSSDLERYFCRELGFTLLVLAAAAVLGLSANGDDTKIALGFGPQGLENPNPSSSKGAFDPTISGTGIPRTVPLLTFLHTTAAVHAYMHNTSSTELGNAFFPPAVFVSGGFTIFGVWCMLFGGDPTRVSRRTGKDRHMANFPFGESERRKEKKER